MPNIYSEINNINNFDNMFENDSESNSSESTDNNCHDSNLKPRTPGKRPHGRYYSNRKYHRSLSPQRRSTDNWRKSTDNWRSPVSSSPPRPSPKNKRFSRSRSPKKDKPKCARRLSWNIAESDKKIEKVEVNAKSGKKKKKKKKKDSAGCHIIIKMDGEHYSVLGMTTRGRCKCNKNKCSECEHLMRSYTDTGGGFEEKYKCIPSVLGEYTIRDGKVHPTIATNSESYDPNNEYVGDIDMKYAALRETVEEMSSNGIGWMTPNSKSFIDIDLLVNKLYVENDYHLIINEDGYHTYVLIFSLDDFTEDIRERIEEQITLIDEDTQYVSIENKCYRINKNHPNPSPIYNTHDSLFVCHGNTEIKCLDLFKLSDLLHDQKSFSYVNRVFLDTLKNDYYEQLIDN